MRDFNFHLSKKGKQIIKVKTKLLFTKQSMKQFPPEFNS